MVVARFPLRGLCESQSLFRRILVAPIEQEHLRVRRLDDNAEDWVANLYIEGHVPTFQWVSRETDKAIVAE